MLSDAVSEPPAQTRSLHTGGGTEGPERGCREVAAWGGDHDKRRQDRAASGECVTQNSGSPSGSGRQGERSVVFINIYIVMIM